MVPRHLVVVCCLLLAAATLGPPTAQAAQEPPPRMIEKINSVRARLGLAPFRHSERLDTSSKRWGRKLMRGDRFNHIGIRSSPWFPLVGEVLAYHSGWRARRSKTVRLWLGSAGHRGALLSTSFKYVGAGLMRGRIGGRLSTIWVVQFGAKRRP